MKILTIGNSFSQDATRYLHQIAKADNYPLKVVNICIGGCPLRIHYNNMLTDQKAYGLEFNGFFTGFKVSINEALLSDEWDYVSIQQVSTLSGNYDTYQPYLTELSAYIKKYAPKAEQIIHQTWAYEQGSHRLCVELGYQDQRHMFDDIQKAYKKASEDLGGVRIIPCGEAFQHAISGGMGNLHRDTYHASLGIGRYILAATWYQTLTGNSIVNNSCSEFDEAVSAEELSQAKAIVNQWISAGV